jgi:hypothetical protein
MKHLTRRHLTLLTTLAIAGLALWQHNSLAAYMAISSFLAQVENLDKHGQP